MGSSGSEDRRLIPRFLRDESLFAWRPGTFSLGQGFAALLPRKLVWHWAEDRACSSEMYQLPSLLLA